jgi:hypothetical protein
MFVIVAAYSWLTSPKSPNIKLPRQVDFPDARSRCMAIFRKNLRRQQLTATRVASTPDTSDLSTNGSDASNASKSRFSTRSAFATETSPPKASVPKTLGKASAPKVSAPKNSVPKVTTKVSVPKIASSEFRKGLLTVTRRNLALGQLLGDIDPNIRALFFILSTRSKIPLQPQIGLCSEANACLLYMSKALNILPSPSLSVTSS